MRFIITQLQPLFLCGKLPTGLKIQIKIHFQPKGSIDCTQAAHSPAAGLSGGCQGPGWGFVLRKAAALQYLCCVSPTLFCSCALFLKFSSTLASVQMFLKLPQTLCAPQFSQWLSWRCLSQQEGCPLHSTGLSAFYCQPTDFNKLLSLWWTGLAELKQICIYLNLDFPFQA